MIISNSTKVPDKMDDSTCAIMIVEVNAPASFNATRIRNQESIDSPTYVIEVIKTILSAYILSPA